MLLSMHNLTDRALWQVWNESYDRGGEGGIPQGQEQSQSLHCQYARDSVFPIPTFIRVDSERQIRTRTR